MDKDFRKFYNELPNDMQQILDTLDIRSFDQLMAMGAYLGVNIDKLAQRAKDGNIESEDVDFEEFMADEDDDTKEARAKFLQKVIAENSDEDELSSQDDQDDEDDGPFTFPENGFLGEACQELHLRIKLLNAPVPVWREIKIPSNVSLALFAWVINEVMGWTNTHLHDFEIGGAVFEHTAHIKMDRGMGFGHGHAMAFDTKDYPIARFFKEKKDDMVYEYDFGDGWRHKIWLKGIREYDANEVPSFVVHKGCGACPPEDCGGIWGYGELLEINAKKRKTAEDKERLEWYGIDRYYDPDYFDIEEAQGMLDILWKKANK